jgi:hypothetical protein
LVLPRARAAGIQRILDVSLALANGLGADAPETVVTRLPDDGNVRELAGQISRGIPESEDYRTDSMRYSRLMLQLGERASDRLRLISRWAFTASVNGGWCTCRLRFFRCIDLCGCTGASRLLSTRAREHFRDGFCVTTPPFLVELDGRDACRSTFGMRQVTFDAIYL